jgi:hypothetical protein
MANPEFRKIVMIGLGGSGQLIVTHLKRLFIDTYGMVPPSIRLLCLDTDAAPATLRSSVSDRQYTLEKDEFLYLSVTDPADFIKSDRTVGNWYAQQRVAVGSINAGAGAVRQNGRLALFFHINEFMRRLDEVTASLGSVDLPRQMETAMEKGATTNFRLSERAAEVYVCGSLAGGTGSGTFLDVGILLRDALPNALIHGFFLLDWIYRNKPFTHRIGGNVYAALAELDSLQGIMAGDGAVPYSMQYGAKRVDVKSPPYTIFNVIDGRNEYGQNIDDPAELCDIVANAIFLSVGSMGHSIASVVDNLLAYVNSSDANLWKGRYARYSSLGVSSIYYPAREFQRLYALRNAVRLCQQVQADAGGASEGSTDIEAVEQKLKDLDLLARSSVQLGVCPFRSSVAFAVQKFQINDPGFPGLVESAEQSAERQLEADLERIHGEDGQSFFDNVAASLRQSISDIQNNRSRDAAYLRDWIDGCVQRLESHRIEAVEERNQAREAVVQCRVADEQLLGAAKAAVHRSLIGVLVGDPRTQAIDGWCKAVVRLLEAIRDARIVEYEVDFYERVTALIKESTPKTVPKASEVMQLLKQAEAELSAALATEQENFKILKAKPTQMLVANGNIVLVPADGSAATKVSVSSGGSPASSDGDLLALSLADFKDQAGIHVGNDYLRYRKKGELRGVFADYAMRKLEPLCRVTVAQALESVEDPDYVKARFDDLFRKASALWSFRAASLSAEQKPHYAKIVNIGVYDAQEAQENYGGLVSDAKAKHDVGAFSFTTTGDPYRIWLLNYAAALPVSLLSDLKERKKAYEEALTPPYHADRFFEMNVPDLYTDGEFDNVALRLLGMAIVRGVDIVRDDKLAKGHRFTFEAPEIRDVNFGDPLIWYLFRDMYTSVKENPQLLQILSDVVKAKVALLVRDHRDELKKEIRTHIDVHLKRLAERDFSRLISARLTYREMKELEKFLDPRGYAMDVSRYIAGK